MRLPLLALCATVLLACGEEGRLLISLDLPSDKAFDPMQDERLSKFSLRIIEGSSVNDQETFRTQGSELRVGSVPVGRSFDLRLAGKSGTGQMLGLGHVFNVNVPGDAETPVAVKFRKPIGFVAGAFGVDMLDSTVSQYEDVPLPQPLQAQNVADVAATPDGAWILAVGGSSLLAFRTSDGKQWAEVKLGAPGTCVAVSPDNRYAVVCHPSNQTVSIINLGKLAESQSDVRPVPVGGAPSRVVFGSDRVLARVLVDGATFGQPCSVQSRLVELNLGSGAKTNEVALGRAVADLALDPRDGRVLLALRCDNALGRVEASGVATVPVAVQNPYDIALTDQYIVILGAASGIGQAVLIDLGKDGYAAQIKKFTLPTLTVSVSSQGGVGWLAVGSRVDAFNFYDMAISPDGQRAVALFEGSYTTNFNVGCEYVFNINARGYMLVDLAADALLFFRFTQLNFAECRTCNHPVQSSCVSWAKGELQGAPTPLLAAPEYDPKGISLLFGGS
jgi:DNA-binding beta-propeller fold protein YncE